MYIDMTISQLGLGETVAINPTFHPLENLPAGHAWSGPEDLAILMGDMLRPDPRYRPDAGDVVARMGVICGETGTCLFISYRPEAGDVVPRMGVVFGNTGRYLFISPQIQA